jgi:hypothetical protein
MWCAHRVDRVYRLFLQFGRGDKHCGTLGIQYNVLCGVVLMTTSMSILLEGYFLQWFSSGIPLLFAAKIKPF